jgi:hypothetical protein
MMNFFKRRILHISNSPIAFGDSGITLSKLSGFSDITDITHFSMNEVTLSCNTWLLDYINYDRIIITGPEVVDHQYDMVILENFYGNVDRLVEQFGNRLYRGISCTAHPSLPLAEIYSKPIPINKAYATRRKQIKQILALSNGKKRILVFPKSTVVLSTIRAAGIRELIKLYPKHQIYLCGEYFDPYIPNPHTDYDTLKDTNVINLFGLGTSKAIELFRHVDLVITAPSGFNVVPLVVNNPEVKVIMMNGGATSLTSAILNHETTISGCSPIDIHSTACPLFPCRNKTDDQAVECASKNEAKCLNTDIGKLL